MLQRFREQELLGKPLTEKQQMEIARSQAGRDEDIDTSDIPETRELPPGAIRGGLKVLVIETGFSIARTDASAITMPTPESWSTPAASMSSADANNAAFTCAAVALGFADHASAAIAAACGAAADVPVRT